MEQLLQILSDGRSRTIEMLANELGTTNDDILRKIDFLEQSKIIRRVATSYSKKVPVALMAAVVTQKPVPLVCKKADSKTWA